MISRAGQQYTAVWGCPASQPDRRAAYETRLAPPAHAMPPILL